MFMIMIEIFYKIIIIIIIIINNDNFYLIVSIWQNLIIDYLNDDLDDDLLPD